MIIEKEKTLPLWYSVFAFVPFILITLIIRAAYSLSQASGDKLRELPIVLHLNAFAYLITTVIVILLLRNQGYKVASAGIKSPESIISVVMWSIGGFAVGLLLIWPLAIFVSTALGLSSENELLIWNSSIEKFLIFMNPVLVTAFAYEFLFRGVFVNSLGAHIGTGLAASISAIVFWLIQLIAIDSGVMLIYTLLWALIPAYLYTRQKNIWSPFLVHALHNLWGLIIVGALFG